MIDGTWTGRLCWLLSEDGGKFLARAPRHRPGDLGRKIDAARMARDFSTVAGDPFGVSLDDLADLYGGFRR